MCWYSHIEECAWMCLLVVAIALLLSGLGCSLTFHSAGSTHINILSHLHTHMHSHTHAHTHTCTYLHSQVSHPFQLQLWPTSAGMSVFKYVWMPERERSGRPRKRQTTSRGAIGVSIECHAVSSQSSHVWTQFACRKARWPLLSCCMMQGYM